MGRGRRGASLAGNRVVIIDSNYATRLCEGEGDGEGAEKAEEKSSSSRRDSGDEFRRFEMRVVYPTFTKERSNYGSFGMHEIPSFELFEFAKQTAFLIRLMVSLKTTK